MRTIISEDQFGDVIVRFNRDDTILEKFIQIDSEQFLNEILSPSEIKVVHCGWPISKNSNNYMLNEFLYCWTQDLPEKDNVTKEVFMHFCDILELTCIKY